MSRGWLKISHSGEESLGLSPAICHSGEKRKEESLLDSNPGSIANNFWMPDHVRHELCLKSSFLIKSISYFTYRFNDILFAMHIQY